MVSYSTGDLIRRAEEDIAAGKHLLALGLLAEAARRDPENRYIGALVMKADKGIEHVCAAPAEPENDGTVSERRARLASLALRGEFGDGIGLLSPGSPDRGVEGRVRLLTMVAINLYERGSFEEAVQSLMKAHMLDPGSPHVEACERLLQPALETMRKGPAPAHSVRKALPEEDDPGRENLSAFLQRNVQAVAHDASARIAAQVRPYSVAGESRRLEALRARQDLERKKREILQWRQASGPPGQHAGKRVHKVGRQIAPDTLTSSAQQQNTPQLSAFFSKLKQGKLFG
jgi:hypothetical protein